MLHVLGLLITTASIAGLAVIVEGATGAIRFLKAYTQAGPRPQAPPHAKAEDDEEEEQCS